MDPHLDTLIALALEEDIGSGDITSRFFVPADAACAARIVAREPAVLAGTAVAAAVFLNVDAALEVTVIRGDGDAIGPGDAVIAVSGATRSILSAERVALNFLQRLSGVATATRRFVDAADNPNVRILDTRKTTPGWRALEKAAVIAGGGGNHRMGLYDQVLVKDNHLLAEGRAEALQEAIDAARAVRPEVKIELEADTLEQLDAFLRLEGVDSVLLDNMTVAELRAAVKRAGGRVILEASGGVSLETVKDIAATGVNCISVGAITHSARAVDLSLELTDA